MITHMQTHTHTPLHGMAWHGMAWHGMASKQKTDQDRKCKLRVLGKKEKK